MKNEIQKMAKDVSSEKIQGRILAMRGVQVILDPFVPAVGAALFAGLWGARTNAYED